MARDVIASMTVICPGLRFCPSNGPTWLQRTFIRYKSYLACEMADVSCMRMPAPCPEQRTRSQV
jgi:hypothetical protein